jgi:allantoinase
VPGNLKQLRGLHEAGVFGFKCFLLDSGVDEFPPLPPDELEPVLAEIAALGSVLTVHAEDAEAIDRGARTHVLHLSSSDALPMLDSARRDGVAVTVETCPHYLTFTAETIPDGATQFKCCPPIREEANRELLWQGLADGLIDIVVSDHSPSTPGAQAPGHRRLRGVVGRDLVAAGGADGDLVAGPGPRARPRRRRAVDGVGPGGAGRGAAQGPDRGRGGCGLLRLRPGRGRGRPARLQHRHPVPAYRGRALVGVVRGTWLRGRRVDLDDEPRGQLLLRP